MIGIEYIGIAILIVAIANFIYTGIRLNKVSKLQIDTHALVNDNRFELAEARVKLLDLEGKIEQLSFLDESTSTLIRHDLIEQVDRVIALLEKEKAEKKAVSDAYRKANQEARQRRMERDNGITPQFISDRNPLAGISKFDREQIDFDKALNTLSLTEEEKEQLESIRQMIQEENKGG